MEGAGEIPRLNRVFLEDRITCQEQEQVVGRSRPAAFLYRPVPVLVVKFGFA